MHFESVLLIITLELENKTKLLRKQKTRDTKKPEPRDFFFFPQVSRTIKFEE